MPSFRRLVRPTLALGLTWAAAWALTGLAIGATSVALPWLPWDRLFAVFDAPLPALALPGFIGGAIFSVVLRTAGRRWRFDDLSLPRVTTWGAVAGVLLATVPDALVLLGLATPAPAALPVGTLTRVIALPLTLLGAVSAAATLWIARRGRSPQPTDATLARSHALALAAGAAREIVDVRGRGPATTSRGDERDRVTLPQSRGAFP